jgi:ribosomal protection tetracycline resistance protein
VIGFGTCDADSYLRDLGEPDVVEDVINVLSMHDDALLARFVETDGAIDTGEIRRSLGDQLAAATVTPVLFGSAMTGAGSEALFECLKDLLPVRAADTNAPLAAEVFKVQRLPKGERVLLCRIWTGGMETRRTVPVCRPHADSGEEVEPAKITGIDRFRDGAVQRAQAASAGDIVRVHGLANARIGDWLGEVIRERVPAFEPPVFESRIESVDPARHVQMNAALAELADQDPLIAVRRNPDSGETFVRLYGEVQREVIGATLTHGYGVEVTFGEPSVVCVERLLGEGRAAEISPDTKPPFYATVGFRIAPKRGEHSTWTFTPGKAKQGFFDAAEEGGRSVLDQGLYGWPVIDWDVEVTDLIYLVSSVPVDYRRLAMLVMADAIRDAGTVVCEPIHEVTITTPQESVGAAIQALSTHRGTIRETRLDSDLAVVSGTVPAAETDALTRALPGLSNGRADIDTRFGGYLPVEGDPPVRRRTDLNPFDRTEFMSRLRGRF